MAGGGGGGGGGQRNLLLLEHFSNGLSPYLDKLGCLALVQCQVHPSQTYNSLLHSLFAGAIKHCTREQAAKETRHLMG